MKTVFPDVNKPPVKVILEEIDSAAVIWMGLEKTEGPEKVDNPEAVKLFATDKLPF